jgi:hypothetical protein
MELMILGVLALLILLAAWDLFSDIQDGKTVNSTSESELAEEI